MKSRRFHTWRIAAVLLGWALALPIPQQRVQAQPVSSPPEDAPPASVDFTQLTRPVARVTDPETMQFLLDELLIEPQDTLSMVEVIDITSNGFGPDDVIVTHPSMRSYKIDPMIVTDSVEAVMGGWAPETEYQFDAGNAPAALFAPDSTTGRGAQRAGQAIMHDLLLALERNYGADLPVSLRLERSEQGFTFQMWDFEADAMQYVPRPAGPPDTTTAFDLLYVARYDSTILTDTAYYDVIYLMKTVEDVVYVPGPPGSDVDGRAGGPRTDSSAAVRERAVRERAVPDDLRQE